jgi:hypothetical protein
MSGSADVGGSVWRRWDPHIHTPETVLNNQFGADDWDAYLAKIEASEPRIEVLAVTDYSSLDRYEDVLGHMESLKVVVAQHVSTRRLPCRRIHAARGGIPPPPYRLASVQCSRWRFVRVWASPTLVFGRLPDEVVSSA